MKQTAGYIDYAEFVSIDKAKKMLHKDQTVFLERLTTVLDSYKRGK